MFERNGKRIFEPGDAVWVYNNYSAQHVTVAPVVVHSTTLNGLGVTYYVDGVRTNYHEGNTFATKEEAVAWAKENRVGWLQHAREEYTKQLRELEVDLREAESDRDDAIRVVRVCQKKVEELKEALVKLDTALAPDAEIIIDEAKK